MIECKDVAEALKVKGVIHIEGGTPVRAYVTGDVLPSHCIIIPPTESPKDDIELLKDRITEIEAQLLIRRNP